jgi:hypothetical protein
MVESSFSSYIYKIKPGEEIPVNWKLLSVSKNKTSISINDITSKPSVGCPLIKQDSVDNKTTWFL